MSTQRALKLPGRVFEQFVQLAQSRLTENTDLDLCEALSRPVLKRRGMGYTVLIPMQPAQVRRLAEWVGTNDSKLLRDYSAAMLAQVEALGAEA